MTDYIKALDGIIQDVGHRHLADLPPLGCVEQSSRIAQCKALDGQSFAFYGTTLSGTEEQKPDWRRAVSTVNGNLGEVVGKVYVKRHFPPEAKERMLELVANLIHAYEKNISELDWMTDDTRAQALDKLSKFTPKIGYPDKWREYDFDIVADDLYGNLERSAIAEYDREVERQGQEVDKTEWGMSPQTVNAYYSPSQNEIVFPAAILQPPFFNLDADDAVNYGAIGAVIGHEIGHGFDDSGSRFDGDGVLRNWWTDQDREEFERRTSKLVEQYNAFAPFDDLHVNGEYTLGENIGDLGGISIGLLAYQMSLDGEEPPVIDGFSGTQRVFLGFAQVWREKYRDEAAAQQDPDEPAFAVDVPCQRAGSKRTRVLRGLRSDRGARALPAAGGARQNLVVSGRARSAHQRSRPGSRRADHRHWQQLRQCVHWPARTAAPTPSRRAAKGHRPAGGRR